MYSVLVKSCWFFFSPSHSLTSCYFSRLFCIYYRVRACACVWVCVCVCVFKPLKINDNLLKVQTHTHTCTHKGALVSLLINHHASRSCQKTLQENCPYNNMAWPQYCRRTAVFFFSSGLANFSIVRASVFTGFNNLKVMVVSFFPPPCHSAFVFRERCDVVLVQL